jgi:hypothetical protein
MLAKAVLMKAAHGGELVRKAHGMSSIQHINGQLDGSGDKFLFGFGLLAVNGGNSAIGGGGVAHGGLSLCWLLRLHFRVNSRHANAERHVANGRAAKRQERSIANPKRRGCDRGRVIFSVGKLLGNPLHTPGRQASGGLVSLRSATALTQPVHCDRREIQHDSCPCNLRRENPLVRDRHNR